MGQGGCECVGLVHWLAGSTVWLLHIYLNIIIHGEMARSNPYNFEAGVQETRNKKLLSDSIHTFLIYTHFLTKEHQMFPQVGFLIFITIPKKISYLMDQLSE